MMFRPCRGHDTAASLEPSGYAVSTVYVFGPEHDLPFEYLGCYVDSAHVMYHVEVKLR